MVNAISGVQRSRGLSKYFGSVLILAGTSIGAGMLAMPLVSAKIGFYGMICLLLVNLVGVVLAALLTLEASLAVEPGACLYTIASRTLGHFGKMLATLSPLILFYALMTAYLSGGGSLVYQYVGGSLSATYGQQSSVLLFALIAGGFVYWSTRSVDIVNRWLFSLMIIALVAALLSISPQIQRQNLLHKAADFSSFLVALPVIFTSFGFHGSVPSIILYLKDDLNHRKLVQVFALAGVLPFIVYFLWLMASMGVLSNEVLLSIEQSGESAGGLVRELSIVSKERYFSTFLHVFSDLALLTSFLGVALGLFDYLASLLNRKDNWAGRLQTAIITFVPPVIFALYYPESFITALGYASIALAILAIFLPVSMVIQIRKKRINESHYQAPGGRYALIICFIYGAVIVVSQCLNSLHVI